MEYCPELEEDLYKYGAPSQSVWVMVTPWPLLSHKKNIDTGTEDREIQSIQSCKYVKKVW